MLRTHQGPCSNPSRAHLKTCPTPRSPLPDVGVRAPTCRSLSNVGEPGFTCRKPILIGVVLFSFRTSQSDGGDAPAPGLIWEIWLPSSAFPNGKDLGSPWADSRGKKGRSNSVQPTHPCQASPMNQIQSWTMDETTGNRNSPKSQGAHQLGNKDM